MAELSINKVNAHRVDAVGRVLGIRVSGTAPEGAATRGVEVELIAGNNWRMKARTNASFVDASALGVPAGDWHAELDLDDHPQLPPLRIGLQKHPLEAKAYIYRSEKQPDSPQVLTKVEVSATHRVEALTLVETYALGVLFVHGIGSQKRSETLAAWTAPLLRWMNNWFSETSKRLATLARVQGFEEWEAMLDRRSELDIHVERTPIFELTRDFVNAAYAKAHSDKTIWQAMLDRMNTLRNRTLEQAEINVAAAYKRHLTNDLGGHIIGGLASLTDARLIDRDAAPTVPSTIELELRTLSIDDTAGRSKWLMAESHWAESFRAPPFGRFAVWCLRAAPITLVHYVSLTHARFGWPRTLCTLPLFGSVVLASMLGSVLLLTLGLVPMQKWRNAVIAMQLRLAGVVGDSYVLIEDPVQRRALIDRVRRDAAWMAQRCHRVVIIAHSQGAALADLAIRERTPEKLHALVTLGNGIQTLKRIEDDAKRPAVRDAGMLMLAGTAPLWVGAGLVLVVPHLGAAIAAGGAVLLTLGAARGLKNHLGLSTYVAGIAADEGWHDFYAAFDLVPWGPIARGTQYNYKAHPVHNRDSFMTDHTNYWTNAEQVVGPIARLLVSAAGSKAMDSAVPDADALQKLVCTARTRRVRALLVARWVTLIGAVAIGLCQRDAVYETWRWVWPSMAAKVGFSVPTLGHPGSNVVWRSLAMLLPLLIYSTMLASVWHGWNYVETLRILRSQAEDTAVGWRLSFMCAVGSIGILCIALCAV